MNIWKTTPPTTQDYPIWAFTDSSNDVVLIRSSDELYMPINFTWCHANIPVKPADPVSTKFQELADSEDTVDWFASDWFRAGYQFAKGSCCSKNSQALNKSQSPFISPEEYWKKLNEPF